ncbi:hypothetical protein MKW92_043649 [Papaver armeniacum]|nr:hypothetical protein MKW92_043649 [Papaver armeniacum]
MEKYGELKSYRMEKFDGNPDFSLWQMNMKDYLVVLDSDDALKAPMMKQHQKRDLDEMEMIEDVTDAWRKMDKKCLSEIQLHLARKVQGHAAIKDAKSAKQLWDSLVMDHISAFDIL